jgi:hypothetical protein
MSPECTRTPSTTIEGVSLGTILDRDELGKRARARLRERFVEAMRPPKTTR